MTMLSINTNVGALQAARSSYSVNKSMEQSMERLASGKRVNGAADDAAGLAIATRLNAEINGINQGIRNASDAQGMLAVAEGALEQVHAHLLRMRELAVQAANGSYSGADRVSLNQEIVSLKKELIRIGETTTFNTTKLLNGTFQDTEFEISFEKFYDDLSDQKVNLKFSDLELIFKDLKNLFERRGLIINWKALENQSLNETINALAMASPFTLEEKQVLLETKNLDARKSKIADILTTYTFDQFNVNVI